MVVTICDCPKTVGDRLTTLLNFWCSETLAKIHGDCVTFFCRIQGNTVSHTYMYCSHNPRSRL